MSSLTGEPSPTSGNPAAIRAERWDAIQKVLDCRLPSLDLVIMCAQAIRESGGTPSGHPGDLLPRDRAEFLALAKRSGIERRYRYTLHKRWQTAWSGTLAEGRPSIPGGTWLYRWFDADDLLLYIGISDDLSARTGTHARESSWMDFADRSTKERFEDRSEALASETAAIESEQPLFNYRDNTGLAARRRLVEYLIRHERLDLLAPAVSRG